MNDYLTIYTENGKRKGPKRGHVEVGVNYSQRGLHLTDLLLLYVQVYDCAPPQPNQSKPN